MEVEIRIEDDEDFDQLVHLGNLELEVPENFDDLHLNEQDDYITPKLIEEFPFLLDFEWSWDYAEPTNPKHYCIKLVCDMFTAIKIAFANYVYQNIPEEDRKDHEEVVRNFFDEEFYKNSIEDIEKDVLNELLAYSRQNYFILPYQNEN